MWIIGYGVEEKFGAVGLSELLGIWARQERYHEAVTLDEVTGCIERRRDDAVLLLCHRLSPTEYSQTCAQMHRDNVGLYTLFVSATPTAQQVEAAGLERTFGLDFLVENLGNWEGHPLPVRRRMAAFVQDAARPERREPHWHLLKLAALPEHVIACYLAALAGRVHDIVPDGWKDAFDEEVRHLCEQHSIPRRLTWQDRTSADIIGSFLKDAEIVEEPGRAGER